MKQKSFEALLDGYINNSLTQAEMRQFLAALSDPERKAEVEAKINSLLLGPATGMTSEQADAVFQKLWQTAGENSNQNPVHNNKAVTGSLRRFYWLAAAVIIGLLVVGGLQFFSKENNFNTQSASAANRFQNDVAPGGNKAELLTADGQRVQFIESGIAQNKLFQTKKDDDGFVVFQSQSNSNSLGPLELKTPNGGQFKVRLSDGSVVWLNASSSLRFPSQFSGSERRVTLSGEGYFEIAKNKTKPFVVEVNGAEIRVLGTHFSVSAYRDEVGVKTTLLEGAVKIVQGDKSVLLKPGDESRLLPNGEMAVEKKDDASDAIAWKEGSFVFEAQPIDAIMRQLARWYNVEIVYKKKVEALFYAEIPRNTPLSDVLKALELTSNVRFAIEDRKIIVAP